MGGGGYDPAVFVLGIVLGLTTAVLQAAAYVFSRRFTLEHAAGADVRGAMVRLLALSHLMQGVACVPLLWAVWPGAMTGASPEAGPASAWGEVVGGVGGMGWDFWGRVVAVNAAYVGGQACLFLALGYTEASRVSPLLGLKVAYIAVIAVVYRDEPLGAVQWVAVGLAVAAAFLLNRAGGKAGRLPWAAVVATLVCCLGYAWSDTFIKGASEVLLGVHPIGPVRTGLFLFAVSYVGLGVVAACVLPWLAGGVGRGWRSAAPYAAAWLLSMAAFFVCLAVLDLTLANILQSTRGIWSVGLGALLAHRGLVHLEARAGRAVWLRRGAAAGLMTLAVALFIGGRSSPTGPDATLPPDPPKYDLQESKT